MAKLTLAEMETVVQYDRASDIARVYTHDRALITAVERRKIKPVQEHIHGGQVVAKSFEVPKSLLSVGLKPKRSEAQRRAAATNLQKALSAQNKPQRRGDSAPNDPSSGQTPSKAARGSQ